MQTKGPAKNPCGSCPYRRDVPSGVWAPEEYEKLPEYDKPTAEQPLGIFLCHQQNGRVCAGWAGCHDMHESLGIRLASLVGLDPSEVLDYSTTTPLFASGAEAAAHGMRNIEAPEQDAERVINKLERKRQRKDAA